MGEFLAWMVGWALILEYAGAARAVSVGWSGYFVGLLDSSLGLKIPAVLTAGPYGGGIVNLPALVIALPVTWLLLIGTTESARVNAAMVVVKITAVTVFIERSEARSVGKEGVRKCRYWWVTYS